MTHSICIRLCSVWVLPIAVVLDGCGPHALPETPATLTGLGLYDAKVLEHPNPAVALGRYQSALDQEINTARDPEYNVPYPELQELLARIDRLDSRVLRNHRRTLLRQVLASPSNTLGLARILVAICGQLKDADSVVMALQAFPVNAQTESVRMLILNHALGDLHDRRLYHEIVRNSDVIQVMLRGQMSHRRRDTQAPEETAAALYEALLAQRLFPQARQVSDWILAVSRHGGTYLGLIQAAERVASEQEVLRLRDEANRVLPNAEKHDLEDDSSDATDRGSR